MLVLSRKKNEIIDLDGGFSAGGTSITVVEIRGDKVRLGIDAPRSVGIHRREVTEAIRARERELETAQ